MQRVAKSQSLVEVDHELDVRPHGLANDSNGAQIVFHALATETQLESFEAALRDQLAGLPGERSDIVQPEPVAVVSRYGVRSAAKEHRERHVRRLGQRVPRGHIQAGNRNHRDPFVANQVQRLARTLEIIERTNRLAFAGCRQIVNRRDDVARRVLQIGLEVTPPHDPLVGVEVDQDQRPLIEETDLGYDRTLERYKNRPDVDRLQREFFEDHGRPPSQTMNDIRPQRDKKNAAGARADCTSYGVIPLLPTGVP